MSIEEPSPCVRTVTFWKPFAAPMHVVTYSQCAHHSQALPQTLKACAQAQPAKVGELPPQRIAPTVTSRSSTNTEHRAVAEAAANVAGTTQSRESP